MTQTGIPCSACGEVVDAEARFCPQCGAVQSAAQRPGKAARTMIGVSAEEVAQAVAKLQAPQAQPGREMFAKTMISQGMPALAPVLPDQAVASSAGAAAASASGTKPGIPASETGNSASAEVGAVKHVELTRGRTMLGVPDPGVLAALEQQAASDKGGTEVDSPALQEASIAAQARKGGTEVDSPALQQASIAAQQRPLEVPPSAGLRLTPPDSVAPVPRGNRARWLVGVALLSLVAGSILYMSQNTSTGDVEITVENGDEGELMQFRVKNAVEGDQVEFGGQTRALENGVVRFPLAPESIEMGDNEVLAQVIHVDGSRDEIRASLHVDYRLRLDTSPLGSPTPGIDFLVSAAPGTRVQLDGQDIALDDKGRATQRQPVEAVVAGSATTWEHRVHYRLDLPQGSPSHVEGELHTTLPVTLLRVNSPGIMAIVDTESIQLAGVVDPGAELTINGSRVEVGSGGQFSYALPLATMGRHEASLVASAAGRAPATTSIEVTRVEDLSKAALTFVPEKKLSYKDVATQTEAFKGQRVDFTGRVFNVKVEAGHGVLQMLVRDCDKGQMCSLWVTLAATTAIEVDSWVRVLGTLEGEQQFRSQSDEIVVVPRVHALFVLPVKS